jgi:hypothetical protein
MLEWLLGWSFPDAYPEVWVWGDWMVGLMASCTAIWLLARWVHEPTGDVVGMVLLVPWIIFFFLALG